MLNNLTIKEQMQLKKIKDVTRGMELLGINQVEIMQHIATGVIGGIFEVGTVNLTNSKDYPFNDSEKIVALKNNMGVSNYAVLFDFDDINVDKIYAYSKQTNGFKLAYTGSSKAVTATYYIIKGEC